MLLSEDEMRYQPQMSVTPPNGFLHASPQLQAKKSSPKNTHNPRKKVAIGTFIRLHVP